MFATATRTFARRTFQKVQSVRKFSGNADEAAAEASKWVKYSIGMIGLCGLCSIYNVAIHAHPHGRNDLPYMNIRNKPYPWVECPDCNIFTGSCWAKCRGEEVEEEHH